MNYICSVAGCSSYSKKNSEITFHQFPTEGKQRVAVEILPGNKQLMDRRKAWILKLNIEMPIRSYMKVCSLHFTKFDYFVKDQTFVKRKPVLRKQRQQLKKTAVPSQMLPSETNYVMPGPSRITKSTNKGKANIEKCQSAPYLKSTSFKKSILITLSEPVNSNRLGISKKMDSPYTQGNQDNMIKEMELEILNLERCIFKARSKYLTSVGTASKIKKIFMKDQLHPSIKNESDSSWSNKTMIKGLKIRFALGKEGYQYLRDLRYPFPSCTALNRMTNNIVIKFGAMTDLIPILQVKVSVMKKEEADCILCIGEMNLCNEPWFNANEKACANVTLGKTGQPGSHLMVILLRGLNSDWNQIVSTDVTAESTEGNAIVKRINEVFEIAKTTKLNIRGIISDMSDNSKSMLASLGVEITRPCVKKFFKRNNTNIHVFVDFQLLLQNLKTAVLNNQLTVSQTIAENENFLSCSINGNFVCDLWCMEQENPSLMKLLPHLQSSDVFPEQFKKTDIAAMIRFFSTKTAAGLETATRLTVLKNHNALATAWFIRLINKWHSIVTSNTETFSITKLNVVEKIKFLENFIFIIQNIESQSYEWRALSTGLILSTTSFINLTKDVFEEDYSFLLGSRLSHGALENFFFEFEEKYPKTRNCLKTIRLLTLSKLLSD